MVSLSQNYIWGSTQGSNSGDYADDCIVDVNGNIYYIGEFRNTMDMDPGLSIVNKTAFAYSDMYIIKLDSNHTFQWMKHLGGGYYDIAKKIVIDSNGDLIVYGTFSSDLSENTAPNVVLPCNYNNGNTVIMKLNPTNGSTIWMKAITGPNGIDTRNLKIKGNDIYLIGIFNGTVDFDPNIGVDTFTSVGNTRMFLTKMDINGNYQWTKVWGTEFDDVNGYDLAIDSMNNIYIVGDFYNQVDFDPNPAIAYNLITLNTCRDAFILKLNSTGNLIYVKQYPSETYSSIQTVNLLNNAQTLVMTGAFYGYFDHNPSPSISMMDTSVNNIADPFITMLDTAGNLISFKKYNVGPYGSVNIVKTMTDSYNNFYVCGSSRYPIDFDFGNDSLILGNLNTNAFVAKYNLLNELFWAKMAYTNSSGLYNSIAFSGNQSLMLHGTFDGDIDYNLDSTILYSSTSLGFTDVFLSQIGNCIQGAQNNPVTACNQYNIGPFTYTQSSNVMVSYPSSAQCDSIINYQLTIFNPNIGVSQSANTLTAMAAGANYQWINCATNTIIPNATNQSYTATSNGSYAVIVSQNGCSDTSLCYVINGLSLDMQSINDMMVVYPNPTEREVNIDLHTKYHKVNISLLDMIGREIYFYSFKDISSLKLAMPNMAGIYILKVIIDGRLHHINIIKE